MDASCIRTQDTFRRGEGAFIANTDGPVRAIRDFVGANSGPHVQRQHVFYGGLEVINTFLRVHPIPGVMDFFDYSAAGVGLTYENGVMTPGGIVSGTPPGGVPIDGQPDAVSGAGIADCHGFESVDGPQGGLSMTQRLLTNNPDPAYRLVYRDGNVTGQNLCTGDDEELYGASGPQLNSAVNNTDEAGRVMWGGGQFSNLFYQRSIYYEAPWSGRRAAQAGRDAGAARALASGHRVERGAFRLSAPEGRHPTAGAAGAGAPRVHGAEPHARRAARVPARASRPHRHRRTSRSERRTPTRSRPARRGRCSCAWSAAPPVRARCRPPTSGSTPRSRTCGTGRTSMTTPASWRAGLR